jgi:hypothetical protein
MLSTISRPLRDKIDGYLKMYILPSYPIFLKIEMYPNRFDLEVISVNLISFFPIRLCKEKVRNPENHPEEIPISPADL